MGEKKNRAILKGHTLLGLKQGSHNISSIGNTSIRKGFVSMLAFVQHFINCAEILAGEKQVDFEVRRLLSCPMSL